MQQFKVHNFVYETYRLAQWIDRLKCKQGKMDEAARTKLSAYIEKYIASRCRDTGVLPYCTDASGLLIKWLAGNRSYSDTVKRLEELANNIQVELRSQFFLSLTPIDLSHYKNWRDKWEAIIERFPATMRDVEETHKCYALSRYPASVFHSLQIAEFGVIELGKFIKVTDPQPGWDATVNKIKEILKKKYQDLDSFEKQHRDNFEQIHGTIEAMKSAWRNKISHANNKLKLLTADLAPERAEEILVSTRGFMSRLAEALPPRAL